MNTSHLKRINAADNAKGLQPAFGEATLISSGIHALINRIFARFFRKNHAFHNDADRRDYESGQAASKTKQACYINLFLKG